MLGSDCDHAGQALSVRNNRVRHESHSNKSFSAARTNGRCCWLSHNYVLVYAAADFSRWYVNHFSTEWEDDAANYEAYKAELLTRSKLSEEDRRFMEEHELRLGALWRGEALQTYGRLEKVIPWISWARAAIDFLLPLIVGGLGLYLLVNGSRNAI